MQARVGHLKYLDALCDNVTFIPAAALSSQGSLEIPDRHAKGAELRENGVNGDTLQLPLIVVQFVRHSPALSDARCEFGHGLVLME